MGEGEIGPDLGEQKRTPEDWRNVEIICTCKPGLRKPSEISEPYRIALRLLEDRDSLISTYLTEKILKVAEEGGTVRLGVTATDATEVEEVFIHPKSPEGKYAYPERKEVSIFLQDGYYEGMKGSEEHMPDGRIKKRPRGRVVNCKLLVMSELDDRDLETLTILVSSNRPKDINKCRRYLEILDRAMSKGKRRKAEEEK